MPEIRYTLQVGEDVFKETELVRRVKSTAELVELVASEIVRPLQQRRERLGEPCVSLLHVEVTNPHIHVHDWQHTYKNRSNLRSIYVCRSCEATGWKPLNIVSGETSKHINRDEKFKHDKWGVCRDILKQGPKKLSFKL